MTKMLIISIEVYPLHVEISTNFSQCICSLAFGIKYPLISEKHKMFRLLKLFSRNG